MKRSSRPLILITASSLVVSTFLNGSLSGNDDVGREAQSSQALRPAIDAAMLEKVRPLFPDIELERGPSGNAYFLSVQEVARVQSEAAEERLVVWVGVIVPAMVDHGWCQLLIYEDADDPIPVARLPGTYPGVCGAGACHARLIENRWLQFGPNGCMVSLTDELGIEYLAKRQGFDYVSEGLTREAAIESLEIYLNHGREAFLDRAPIREHQESRVHLPDQIAAYELYPSLVEDMRFAGFRYSDSWEAMVLVRLTPSDETQTPVILEMGARASSGGILSEDVELLLWETRTEEPTDRPAPVNSP